MHLRILHAWHGWFLALFLFCAALVFSNLFHWILFRFVRRKQEHDGVSTGLGLGINRYLARPARAIFIITCLFFVQPALPIPADYHHLVRQTLAIVMVISLGWFATGIIYVVQNIFLRRYDLSSSDNVQARRVHTQFQVLRRMLITFIVVVTMAGVFWTFHDDRLWKAGSGLLASAGIASLVLAAAAKSTASNFLAGMQIAITEPIRIDDVVVVQNEWGKIEEITSSYVVVKIWDLRRLIVPLSYFIENSFYNWSRQTTDILGTAFLYVDYSIPVEDIRSHLDTVVKASPLWDKKVCGLQVTNLSEKTMELRCLMSSRNASENFDLRCVVREEMTKYIQKHYPNAFPTVRFAAIGTSNPNSPHDQPTADQSKDHPVYSLTT